MKQLCMTNCISVFIIAAFCAIFYSCSDDPNPKEQGNLSPKELPQVAVLGILHFVSKDNTVSQEFNDVKSTKRQQEIINLVNQLKAFRPTKIAIERPYRTDEELNNAYHDYLKGTYELTAEEADQLGFRLAKALNHEKLYLAYAPVQYAFDSVVAFAKANHQSAIIDSIIINAQELAGEYDKIATTGSIVDAIYYLNTEKAIQKNHYGYLLLSQIGDEKNKIGADAVGDWYASNIKIFDNIRQMCTAGSDRILVIYGQGHSKILNQLIEDSPELELADVKQYIR